MTYLERHLFSFIMNICYVVTTSIITTKMLMKLFSRCNNESFFLTCNGTIMLVRFYIDLSFGFERDKIFTKSLVS